MNKIMKKFDVEVKVWARIEMVVEAETEEEARRIGDDYWSDEDVEYNVEEIDVNEIN